MPLASPVSSSPWLPVHSRRAALLAGCSLLAGAALGQPSPARPLTLVVPFAPGGNADMVARSVSGPMARLLGQGVVIDNRGGAGGSIGTAWVAKAAPDGHTLLAATPGQLGTLPHLLKTPYQRTDFVPLGVLSKTSIALVVRHNGRFKSAEDLIAQARARPGELNVGHAGPGSPNHLAMLQFEQSAGCRFTAVPYKGSGPALVDLLSGKIDLMFDQVSSSLPHLKSGALAALLVLAPARDVHLAGVRTLAEAGLQGFDASTYLGLLAPRGLPAAAVARLTAVVEQLAGDAAFDRGLREMGSAAFHAGPLRFEEILMADEALAAALIRQGRLVNE